MRTLNNKAVLKLFLGAVLTGLVLSPVSALEIENIEEGDFLPDEPEMLVGSSDAFSGNISFVYDGEDYYQETIEGESIDSGENSSYTPIDVGENDYGSYEISVNSTSDGFNDTVEDITIDGSEPDVEFTSSSEYVSNEEPEVEVEVEDERTDLANITLEFEDSDLGSETCDSLSGQEDSCSMEPDDDLEDGEEYEVYAEATDEVGNSGDESWSFTVDTEYDGDSDPDLSVESANGYVIFDEDVDLTVEMDESDSVSETEVTCYVEGEEVDSFSVDAGEEDIEEECEIEYNFDADYFDQDNAEIYVEMEDEAGNSESSDEIEVGFDAEPPTVTDFETELGASNFNDDFVVEYDAFNSVSDMNGTEYYFDFDTEEGEGNLVDYTEESFTVETSDLESGSHTVYVRAGSEAGRWSSPESLEFGYYPDKDPEIELDTVSELQIDSGESEELEVDIENVGELFVSSFDLELNSDIISAERSIENMSINDTRTEQFEIQTGEEDIGDYELEVSSDFSDTHNIDLRVNANDEQAERFETNFSESFERFQELEQNVTELSEDLNQDRQERLSSNFTSLNSSVADANESLGEEKYYEVQPFLEGFETQFQQAKDSYDEIKQEHETAQRNKIMMILFGLVSLTAMAGVGGLVYTGKLDPEEIKEGISEKVDEQDIEKDDYVKSLKNGIDKLKLKFQTSTGQKEEAEEFEWEGFGSD